MLNFFFLLFLLLVFYNLRTNLVAVFEAMEEMGERRFIAMERRGPGEDRRDDASFPFQNRVLELWG